MTAKDRVGHLSIFVPDTSDTNLGRCICFRVAALSSTCYLGYVLSRTVTYLTRAHSVAKVFGKVARDVVAVNHISLRRRARLSAAHKKLGNFVTYRLELLGSRPKRGERS